MSVIKIIFKGIIVVSAIKHTMMIVVIILYVVMNVKNGFMPFVMESDPKILLNSKKVKLSIYAHYADKINHYKSEVFIYYIG
jgi:hypothetical protein